MTLVTIHQKHVEFLRENNIYVHASERYDKTWLQIGKQYNTRKQPALMERYSGQFGGGCFSSLGAFSYSGSNLGPNATVGRYCAIAEGSTVMKTRHPIEWLGMSGFDYSLNAPFGAYAKDHGVAFPTKRISGPLPEIVVEDGVWLAADILFSNNVRIGAGSVVAARSVVTKDVPPYSVVAGSPAVVKKMRFSEKTIERLLVSDWTDYAFTDFAAMETTDIERFLDQLEEAKTAGKLRALPRERIDVHAEFRRIAEEVVSKQA